MIGYLSLAVLFGLGPVCAGPDEPLRRALVVELNLARMAAGARPVVPHPLLCRLAGERAAAIAASGELDPDRAHLEQTTRALYRGGYPPHFWSEGALVGGGGHGLVGRLGSISAEWVERAITGDFEHLGIGTARLDGQPVVALLLALHKCTEAGRRAAGLADVAAVRAAALVAVNRARRQRGRQPVRPDPRLDAAAQGHAEEMLRRGFYDHLSPDGGTPAGRARAAGLPHAALVAENIARGLFTPAETVERWLASSGHRRNILLRRATATGLGVAVGPGGDDCVDVLWVQLFAG